MTGFLRIALVLACACAGSLAHGAEVLRMAVTTSFQNSGLAAVLVPQIEADLDMDVQLLVVGTGQALRLGKAGDVDAVLVHARRAEEAFVEAGHAPHRREIMYNDFVILGPSDDPAAAQSATSAKTALRLIADAKLRFVSRGDDSGTHQKEQSLWAAADLAPESFGAWYASIGAGMGAALNTASGLNAYVLSDRASWLNFNNKGNLQLLYAGDPALFNQYSFLPVSPTGRPHVNAAGAARLEDWLTSDKAAGLINGYRLQDQQVFTFNAKSRP